MNQQTRLEAGYSTSPISESGDSSTEPEAWLQPRSFMKRSHAGYQMGTGSALNESGRARPETSIPPEVSGLRAGASTVTV
jgi:hypothetical protein